MAGHPKMRADEATLERIGEEAVFMLVLLKGVKPGMREIGISFQRFYGWLDREKGRRDRYVDLRPLRADVLVEQAVEILDECDGLTNSGVALAKAQADIRFRLAAKLHKQLYGTEPSVQLNVLNAGELHLDALRQVGHMDLQRIAAQEAKQKEERDRLIEEADYKILPPTERNSPEGNPATEQDE